jgi:3-deoxy-manno-octulosonate cytidylyltransferase (CMP-KDO synthetase)
MFRVVIPARYASVRLPGKALQLIAGKPMVQWVYERATEAGATEVLIATDDARIAAAARSFGAPAVMTAVHHASGTDRIAEVARARGWPAEEIVVNLQGDEPLMPAALIGQVAAVLGSDATADIATLAAPIGSVAELLDANVVKVVVDARGHALYFSRAPIPWNRAAAAADLMSQTDAGGARRHIGIYAYRVASLLRLAALAPSELETREKLEQLRALENGLAIRVAVACESPGPDVNTPEDLERAAQRIAVQTR